MVDVSPDSDPAAVAAAAGVKPELVFTEGTRGFSADLTPAQVAKVKKARGVLAVAPDRVVAKIPRSRRQQFPEQPAQMIKSGQRRVGLLESQTADVDGRNDRPVDADIAILDTTVARHPDLNLFGGVNCLPNSVPSDGEYEYHGTMVAGIAAAIDNKIGIAGVAPGARLWSVRVADADGYISNSALRCGLEWLVRRAADIEVANFSFGEGDPMVGPCGVVNRKIADVLHFLACRAVDKGVTIVAAASNEGQDVGLLSPGAWPEVITVSAVAETDGLPGGLGPSSVCFEPGEVLDDTFAFFSNFGHAVDIAAPGVCVTSTYPGGLYAVDSGTSYSTPFVSGAAALLASKRIKIRPTPAEIRGRLLAAVEPGPIAGDPDAFPEGLLQVGSF